MYFDSGVVTTVVSFFNMMDAYKMAIIFGHDPVAITGYDNMTDVDIISGVAYTAHPTAIPEIFDVYEAYFLRRCYAPKYINAGRSTHLSRVVYPALQRAAKGDPSIMMKWVTNDESISREVRKLMRAHLGISRCGRYFYDELSIGHRVNTPRDGTKIIEMVEGAYKKYGGVCSYNLRQSIRMVVQRYAKCLIE